MKSPKRWAAMSLVFTVLTLMVGWALIGLRQLPPEPAWNGKSLSEWLDIYDSCLRFPVEDGRHPSQSDAEIEQALNGIGTNALPFLQAWLVQQPERLRPWVNTYLTRVGLSRFYIQLNEEDRAGMSINGFIFYGPMAEPLLPWLIQLSHDKDADVRGRAYAAAFFVRTKKEIFLPLADQALHDDKADCVGMAAQWMLERFPDEGVKRKLNVLYPQFCEDATGTNSIPP